MHVVLHVPPFLKQAVQLIFQSVFIRNCRKMIRIDMTAALCTESPAQKCRKMPQQLISLSESVFMVERLHSAQIDIKQRRKSSLIQHRFSSDFGKFKEIADIRKPGQIIIISRASAVLLPEHFTGSGVITAVFVIFSLFREPDLSKAQAVIGIHALSVQMDDLITRNIFFLRPVNHIKPAALSAEAEDGIRKQCGIVRMDIPEHVLIHVGICLCAVIITKQFTETVRYNKSHNAFLQELADSKRLPHPFNKGSLFYCQLILLHHCQYTTVYEKRRKSAIYADHAFLIIISTASRLLPCCYAIISKGNVRRT